MASPHAAGAVALCLGESGRSGPCTGLTPAQIVQKLRADADAHTGAITAYGFSGDPVRAVTAHYYGYLQWSPTGPSQPRSPRRTPSDFDGDGKADMAVWRPSNATFYVRTSTTGFDGFLARQWGASDSIPLANTDFDGDGKADMAIWHPPNGTFYVRTSTTGFDGYLIRQWGASGDVPISRGSS